MKFLHLADLHLGKRVNDISMIDDQKFVIEQIVDLVNEEIDTVLISGDIFDKSIPNTQALELFGDFLKRLNDTKTNIFIISGNHDNSQRLSYLNPLLKKANIFISDNFEGKIQSIQVDNDICIHLMPYLNPMIIKNYYPNLDSNDYNAAIKKVLDSITIDRKKINILLSHQFVSTKGIILSDSEQKSVGGVDSVDYRLFEKFDYVALGHLHCPQKAGLDKIRYSGSILKYSFSEINQKKKFTIFEFDKDKNLKLSYKDIIPKHDLVRYRGYLDQFLDEKFYSKIKVDDYIHFILLDNNLFDAKKTLSTIYPNIMILEFDNEYTRQKGFTLKNDYTKEKTIYNHFLDFYKTQIGLSIDSKKKEIVREIINASS